MSRNKCFVCTGEIQNGTAGGDNSSSEENSILLCKILELSNLEGIETKKFEGREISYCRLCLNRILNICDMLEEMERLEKKVLDEKYSIELQLRDKAKAQKQNSSDELRREIGTELRAASIGSMLDKIRNKRVGQRRNSNANAKGSRHTRIMESVTIPDTVFETVPPISHDQVQTERTLQESQSQLDHQQSCLPNSQKSSLMMNRDGELESQTEDTNSQEPVATNNVTETSWASDNEECDIKYEMRSDADMSIDPPHSEMEHLDFPQPNDLISQMSTKLDVDDLPDVTQFSDAHQTTSTATENPTNNKNFICGTCGVGFVSNNRLRIHDRVHLKSTKGKSSTLKNIRRKKTKLLRSSTNLPPSLRPKKCEECGKVLSSKFSWADHVMAFHRGQYKFKCTLCNYGCQRSYDLRKHTMGVHSVNSEDLKCSKCDKVFKTKRARTMHMLKCSVVLVSCNITL